MTGKTKKTVAKKKQQMGWEERDDGEECAGGMGLAQ